MKKTATLIAAITILAFIAPKNTYAGFTVKKKETRITDYSQFNIATDSLPRVVSPTILEIFYHIEVPNNSMGYFTSLAAHYTGIGSGTPIYTSVQDSAGPGYTGVTKTLTGLLSGDTIISTVFGYDNPFTHEVSPYQIFWITSLDPYTGVPVTQQLSNYVTVGPNPTHDFTTVNTPIWRGTTLHVFDILGHAMIVMRATGTSTILDTRNLPNGMYELVAEDGAMNMKISTKFVKQ